MKDTNWTITIITILSVNILMFIGLSHFAVTQTYLGYYPDDNITIGSQEWIDWHEIKLNQSKCVDKEILATIDVCGGHVTTFCKKYWFPGYMWTEIHCMDNQFRFEWWWE